MIGYDPNERERRDAGADTYDSWYVENKGALFDELERRELFAACMPLRPTSRVLDVGAGTGRIAERFPDEGCNPVLCDLSEASLLHAAMQKGLTQSVCGTATATPFAAQCFDVIVSCQMFQHLGDERLELALEECRRTLRPGGRLVLSGYNGSNSRSPEWLTAAELRELLSGLGFSVRTIRYFKVLPLRRVRSPRWLVVDRALSMVKPLARRVAGYQLIVAERAV